MKVYDAAAIRNVAMVGHGGCGKTQLVSTMLFVAGAVNLSMLLVVLGVFGGAIAFGFIGLFVGPALLAVGWDVTKKWLDDTAEDTQDEAAA